MFTRILMLALLSLFATGAMAQSADQEVVSVVDSPDAVVPGQNITYTVTMRNNGPDAAANGGLNVNLGQWLTHVSNTPPVGFTCFVAGANMSCLTPSFAPGTTAVIAIVVQLDASQLNFPDGSVTSNFYPSGTTPDPNNGNNNKAATTAWDSPQIDLAVAVTDTPDSVGPDQTISYALQVTNAGPNSATNVNVNVFNNGSLRFQSITHPVGFSCTPLAVGAAPILTCSKPTLAPGIYDFTVVLLADDAVLGINDTTVQTAFGVNGTGNDTNWANDVETETTNYVTPDANIGIAVVDFPDPVILGQSFEYLVTMTNNGPDAASNATMSLYNPGTLRFQSIEAPQSFNCTTPAVGAAPTLSCTIASMANGASAEFIVTVRSDVALMGEQGGSVQTSISGGANTSDPNNANNAETETTTIIPDLLFRNGFEG